MPFQSPFLWKKGILGMMMSSQAEDTQKKTQKQKMVAVDKGQPGLLVGAFPRMISESSGQGFSFRLLGKAMGWQTWVSRASLSLHMGQVTPEGVWVWVVGTGA